MGQTGVGVDGVRRLFTNRDVPHFGLIQDYNGQSIAPASFGV
jgi:hypothetical protein